MATIDEIIGVRIRRARKAAEMTQKQLGEILGLTQKQISRLERGRDSIYAEHIVKIARATNYPSAWFLDDDNTKPASLFEAIRAEFPDLPEREIRYFVRLLRAYYLDFKSSGGMSHTSELSASDTGDNTSTSQEGQS